MLLIYFQYHDKQYKLVRFWTASEAASRMFFWRTKVPFGELELSLGDNGGGGGAFGGTGISFEGCKGKGGTFGGPFFV